MSTPWARVSPTMVVAIHAVRAVAWSSETPCTATLSQPEMGTVRGAAPVASTRATPKGAPTPLRHETHATPSRVMGAPSSTTLSPRRSGAAKACPRAAPRCATTRFVPSRLTTTRRPSAQVASNCGAALLSVSAVWPWGVSPTHAGGATRTRG